MSDQRRRAYQRISPAEQVATFVGFTFFVAIATAGLLALVYTPIYLVVTSFQ